MQKQDLDILPLATGVVEFQLVGKTADTGHALLQRLITLLLCDHTDTYRDSMSDVNLLQFLEGGNCPTDASMNAALAICCAAAVNMLDEDDREVVESFDGLSEDGKITCTLTLTDGTTVTGII